MKWDEYIRRIGTQTEMLVVNEIESVIPDEYKVYPNGERAGPDVKIKDRNDNLLFTGEVKTAKEKIFHTWLTKKGIFVENPRRGMFNIEPHQLDVDFYAFVIRFVDFNEEQKGFVENGDYEIYYALGKIVREYLGRQTLNCRNYKLNINKLIPELNVIHSFLPIFNKIKKEE